MMINSEEHPLAVLPDLFVVGGAVRDRLLGRDPGDVDYATSATPDEMMNRADSMRAATDKTVEIHPTGTGHGTVTVRVGDRSYEVTTFRRDVSTDGRRAEVEWVDSIEEDLARRDFTINAMARSVETGELIDPYDGQEDLQRGRICTVGEPGRRFREDRLRILRGVRFAGRYDFQIEPSTWDAMQKQASAVLQEVAMERLLDEVNRMLMDRVPSRALRLLWELGLFQEILPEAREWDDLNQNPEYHPEGHVLNHVLNVVDRAEPRTRDGWPAGRWAALLHDIGKGPAAEPAEDGPWHTFHGHEKIGADCIATIADRLRFPGWLAEELEVVTRLHMLPLYYAREGKRKGLARRLQEKAGDHLGALEALCRADAGDRDRHLDFLFQDLPTPTEPILKGRHLIDAGYEPGPEFGTALDAAKQHQIETGCEDRSELLAVAEEAADLSKKSGE